MPESLMSFEWSGDPFIIFSQGFWSKDKDTCRGLFSNLNSGRRPSGIFFFLYCLMSQIAHFSKILDSNNSLFPVVARKHTCTSPAWRSTSWSVMSTSTKDTWLRRKVSYLLTQRVYNQSSDFFITRSLNKNQESRLITGSFKQYQFLLKMNTHSL